MTWLFFSWVALFVGTFFSIRGLLCNEKTYTQRGVMIRGCVDNDTVNWQAKLNAFESVSYTRHKWTVMTFRDPFKLYTLDGWSYTEADGWAK